MDNFDGSLLIPSIAATSYFRYDGSLTVPDCTESVIWTVFSKTVKISKSQMEQFRMLNGDSSLKQTVQKNTFRELQNLNGREILCNFKKAWWCSFNWFCRTEHVERICNSAKFCLFLSSILASQKAILWCPFSSNYLSIKFHFSCCICYCYVAIVAFNR